jgi:nitrogen fixation protein NifU and related proteins
MRRGTIRKPHRQECLCYRSGLQARRATGILLDVYSATVLDHFKNPRNAGDLPGATAEVEVSNPACGDIMRLSVRVEHGVIAEARFKTRGCVTAIACGSLLTEMLEGKTVAEARAITYQQISEALGGLPPATMHGSQLASDALEALLAKL